MAGVSWGIVACGSIARAFAGGLQQTTSGSAVAVASRSADRAKAFADEFDIPRSYGGYQALLDDTDVDAVYIATPHPQHARWAIRAAEAGKHVLCEKPLTLNHADAMTVVEAARRHGVFLMEAYMYRCHPQLALVRQLIEDGVIGEVRMVEASFGFNAGDDFSRRTLDHELGGGGILDVGGYPLSFARIVGGVLTGQPVAEPLTIHASGVVGEESGIDEWTGAVLEFDSGLVASIATAVRLGLTNTAKVMGSKGSITMLSPWLANGRAAGNVDVRVQVAGQPEEVRTVHLDRSVYAAEADEVARCLEAGLTESPVVTWADTLGNMKGLDAWRDQIGCSYRQESVAGYAVPLSGRPLSRPTDSTMQYGAVAGIDKAISRLVMGMDNQRTIAHATAMFDDFIEKGGTSFDSAHIYGGGRQESLFGEWITNRGIRDEVVLIGKGAHTPNCYPEKIAEQLEISLERLQAEHVDIYFLHRDNLDVPVGEFVDALNEQRDARRMTVFGGSNWTTERFDAANAYAARKGVKGFSALSNNFSLAQMVQPVWPGCIAASTPDFIAWLADKRVPVFSWSSQARGFFVPKRAAPDNLNDAELVRSWYSDDNFRRQARCFELASARGVAPISVALAYVLLQPFPIFPLIGPRFIAETVSSLEALHVELSREELEYLDLRRDRL